VGEPKIWVGGSEKLGLSSGGGNWNLMGEKCQWRKILVVIFFIYFLIY
jgi:hypothetical protein